MQIQHIAENKVLVSKQSIFSGKVNQMVLPLRQGQIEYWLQSCLLIQDVLPDLDADQREFLLSGSTPENGMKCLERRSKNYDSQRFF